MKTFCINSKTQAAYLVIFLFMFAAMSGVLYFVISVFPISSSDIVMRSLDYFLIAFLAMPILMASWTGYIFYAVRKAKLTFDEQSIRFISTSLFNRVLPPWLKPFYIPYSDIKKIESGKLQPFVRIETQSGNARILFPTIFGNRRGEDILEELKTRIPPEIHEGMEPLSLSSSKWKKANTIQTITSLVFALAIVTSFLFDKDFSIRSTFTKAWEVHRRFPILQSPEAFSLTAPDDYWIITDKFRQYYVYHISHKNETRWKMPTVESNQNINFISNIGENPVVWMEDGVYYHNGSWQRIPYKNNLNVLFAQIMGVASKDKMWVVEKINDKYQILEVDALSGNWQIISLPESATKDDLSPQFIRGATNDQILVLISKGETARVNIYSDGEWKSQEYHLDLSEFKRIADMHLDHQNNLWVISEIGFGKEQSIEKISPNGKTLTTRLPLPSISGKHLNYNRIVIDSLERMWVSGAYPPFISVIQPKWDGESVILQTYSEDNSNFRQDFSIRPILSSTGQIMSIGDYISSIDSNLEELPEPFPVWLSNLDMTVVRLIIMSAYLPYILYLLWLQTRSQTVQDK